MFSIITKFAEEAPAFRRGVHDFWKLANQRKTEKRTKQKPRAFSGREAAGASVWCKRLGLGLSAGSGQSEHDPRLRCADFRFNANYGRLGERFLPASNGTSLTRSPRINPGDSGRNEVWLTHERHLRPTRLCPNEVRFSTNFNLNSIVLQGG